MVILFLIKFDLSGHMYQHTIRNHPLQRNRFDRSSLHAQGPCETLVPLSKSKIMKKQIRQCQRRKYLLDHNL
jgi:hypothetical protein